MEDEFAVMVVNIMVNSAHMKTAPGRKTDAKSLPRTGYGDAEWIAELLQHGLLRAGFIPDRPQRELRELTRYRRSLVEERSREANRIRKLPEGANIKLASVATGVPEVSGRAMPATLAEGETDPKACPLFSVKRRTVASHTSILRKWPIIFAACPKGIQLPGSARSSTKPGIREPGSRPSSSSRGKPPVSQTGRLP